MIEKSCSMCHRPLDVEDDLLYTVRIEVRASLGSTTWTEDDADRDYLQELDEVIETIEDIEDEQIGDQIVQQLRFDLCSDCRKRYIQRPVGISSPRAFDFSHN